MARWTLVGLLAALASCAAPAGPACTEGDYCPGCRMFCGADCPKKEGLCLKCGKAPLAVKTCELTWLWCSTHSVWHADRACAENASKKCCEAAKRATALCLPADTKGLEKGAYCPACRIFCGPECPLDEKGCCAKCARKPVEMAVLPGTWHGCAEHKTWHEGAPCAEHAAKKCCAETKSRVLICHP